MKNDAIHDGLLFITAILTTALIMLVVKNSSQFSHFVSWGSGIFNKSLATLTGQQTGAFATTKVTVL